MLNEKNFKEILNNCLIEYSDKLNHHIKYDICRILGFMEACLVSLEVIKIGQKLEYKDIECKGLFGIKYIRKE